jgi:hypothetical protein
MIDLDHIRGDVEHLGCLSDADAVAVLRDDVTALIAEVGRLHSALAVIRDKCGQACTVDFMTCDHPACASSYGAWAVAAAAIGPAEEDD